ncbi:ABC-F family ATP-binding cassette domain-containing protein [Oligoflexaceae bacterium]|nr:ABC-F family ATP-binding cassette domain-containing protein [Oligoflexaceae bacterium]
MTPLIQCKSLGQTFAGKTLFDGLDFSLSDRDRVGLIGGNGNGKSTLLRIISGDHEADDGQVTRRKHLSMSFVTQSPSFDMNDTVEQAVRRAFKDSHLSDVEKDVQVAIGLSKAGFETPEQPLAKLSGGWLKRLQIVSALVTEPELLLLDEPTNHLDLMGVLWLEEELMDAPYAWTLVTHDRLFLNKTVNRIFEIDPVFKGGAFQLNGKYEEFLEKRLEHVDGQAAYKASLANKVKREEAWLARSPKARSTKSKGRIDRAHEMKDELSAVKGRMKEGTVDVSFSASGRKSKKLMELKDVTVERGGKTIFSDLSMVIQPRQRLGILGPNGSGKSTFLKALMGELEVIAGTIKPAKELKIVYFDQHRDELNDEWLLKRALCDEGDSVVYRDRSTHVVSWAKKFRFTPDQLETPLKDLSGGEKARVQIARMMLKPADILLLDEPTNDLDIKTIEVLEDSLLSFPGFVGLVTHDRYMINKVCNKYLAFDGEGSSRSYQNYPSWERDFLKPKSKSSVPKKSKESTAKPAAKKRSYKEQLEYEAMEKKILDAENEVARLTDAAQNADASDQNKIYTSLQEAQSTVEKLYSRWAELEAN